MLKNNIAQDVLVSIIMPCYNHGQYVEESVQSVLNSTHKNFEIIIVNDGSTDNFTNELLSNHNWLKTKVITIPNQGVAIARNIGIQNSSGKYILPLDADDKISNTYLEKAVNILELKQSVKIVYCEAERFGEINGKWKLPSFNLRDMLMQNCIFCTAMFRKTDFERTKGYNENMRTGLEDWDFWLSILETGGEVYKIPEIGFYYRIRKGSRGNSLTLEKQKELHFQMFLNHKILYERNHLSIDSINEWYTNKKLIEARNNTSLFRMIRFFVSLIRRIR